MFTEDMPGGDVGTALAQDDPSARRLGWYQNGHLVALDIARGLAYLHAQKVCIGTAWQLTKLFMCCGLLTLT